jgi:hypothetical protein
MEDKMSVESTRDDFVTPTTVEGSRDETFPVRLEVTKTFPVRLEVTKNEDGNRFYGNLVWSNGDVWYGWQSFKRMKDVIKNARCTFDGPIVKKIS